MIPSQRENHIQKLPQTETIVKSNFLLTKSRLKIRNTKTSLTRVYIQTQQSNFHLFHGRINFENVQESRTTYTKPFVLSKNRLQAGENDSNENWEIRTRWRIRRVLLVQLKNGIKQRIFNAHSGKS